MVSTLDGSLFCKNESFDINKLHFTCNHVASFVSNNHVAFLLPLSSSVRCGVMKLLSTLGPLGTFVVLMSPRIAYTAQDKEY